MVYEFRRISRPAGPSGPNLFNSNMKIHLRLSRPSLAAIGSLLLLAVPATTTLAGTETTDTKTTTPPEPPSKFVDTTIAFDATHYFDTRFDGLDSSLSVSRYSAYGEFRFKLAPVWVLKIFTYGDFSLYNFRHLPPTAPSPLFTGLLRDAYFVNVDATLAYTFAPGWAIVGGGRIRSAASTDASGGNSFTGGGILAIKKSFFDNSFDLTLGASYTSRLSRPAKVEPYLDFDLNNFPSFVKIPIGVQLSYNGGALLYHVTDQFSLMLKGHYDSRAYRLASNTTVSKGVWSENGLDLGAGIGWTPTKKNWSLSVFGGYEVLRNVQVFANNGSKLFDRDVKPTPFVSVDFHASF
jgi:hypothetical protein